MGSYRYWPNYRTVGAGCRSDNSIFISFLFIVSQVSVNWLTFCLTLSASVCDVGNLARMDLMSLVRFGYSLIFNTANTSIIVVTTPGQRLFWGSCRVLGDGGVSTVHCDVPVGWVLGARWLLASGEGGGGGRGTWLCLSHIIADSIYINQLAVSTVQSKLAVCLIDKVHHSKPPIKIDFHFASTY